MDANEIIKKAITDTELSFQRYPKIFNEGLADYNGTRQEYAKECVQQLIPDLSKYWNVRNDSLKMMVQLSLEDGLLPGIDTNKKYWFADDQTVIDKLLFVLKDQFLITKKIDYLKGLSESATRKHGLDSKLSDAQLKNVYTTFKNKYFATTTEKQFFAAFRPDPLPEVWQRIVWTGTQSHIRYFVKLVSKDYEPEKLKEYITGKTIDSNNQSKYDSLMEKTFLEAIK